METWEMLGGTEGVTNQANMNSKLTKFWNRPKVNTYMHDLIRPIILIH